MCEPQAKASDGHLHAVTALLVGGRRRFHPDRLTTSRITVADGLLNDGIYRNQFETGVSTGSLSAFTGGARDAWERTLFGGAYHASGVLDGERPKYGALELIRFPDGPIPRFGSCYFVLKRQLLRRCSFTFMGSEDPGASEQIGTNDVLEPVVAALLEEIESGATSRPPWPPFVAPTLGVPMLTVAGLLGRMINELPKPRPDARAKPGRVLDTQIEAQVHGPIRLQTDVERLVADPAFAATPTGSALRELCAKYAVPLQWHGGFRLHVNEVPGDFRGPEMPRLARRIVGDDGMLDAAVVGAAEMLLRKHSKKWSDYGNEAQILEHLKQLWHVLVHYGAPNSAERP
jgi:hypothetical protein